MARTSFPLSGNPVANKALTLASPYGVDSRAYAEAIKVLVKRAQGRSRQHL
ncbi:hypothetical protein [Streptomyces sp. NPDC048641]|uniref:hypothetical protein n=1 Tax=Streptomyces sp. NPDC048641 TaxID=3154825 RepID=UPI0034404138